jgi:hypothetical protein
MSDVNTFREALASSYLETILPLHQDLVPVPGEQSSGVPAVYDNSYRLPDKPLPYSCTDEEAMLLGYTIRENKLRNGFEVATAFGFSSLAMGLALRANGGRLLSMDCYVEEEEESIYYKTELVEAACARVQERIARGGVLPRGLDFARCHAEAMGLADTVAYVVGVSPTHIGGHLKRITSENGPLDLAFIDGGHFGDQPLLDFLAVAPYLSKSRCAVFFHDFDGAPNNSIGRAVAEAERQLGSEAVVLATRWKLTLIGRGLDTDFVNRLRQLPWRRSVLTASKEAGTKSPVSAYRNEISHVKSPITPEEISVVVQGAVVGKPDDPEERQLTRLCLESIRRHLPGAEVILSTWARSDVRGLSYDTLLENEDPGAVCIHTPLPEGVTILNNVNRQIVSTRAGLMAASRPYALKIRTDFALTGTGFQDYFGLYPERADAWRLVQERVLACTVFSRNPRRKFPFLFHPSDFVYFGRREDVLGIWNIPLAPEPETSRWFETRPRPKQEYFPGLITRYVPEQWIWLSFLRKHGDVPLEHLWEISPEMLALSELTIANNLVLLEPWQWQIHTNKPRLQPIDGATIYSHGDWLRLYKHYCAPRTPLQPDFIRLARTTRYYWDQAPAAIRKRIFSR